MMFAACSAATPRHDDPNSSYTAGTATEKTTMKTKMERYMKKEYLLLTQSRQ